MSLVLSADGDARQINVGLNSLSAARRVLLRGDIVSAARLLAEFRRSPIGSIARQAESDLIELGIQARQNAPSLVDHSTRLVPRHAGRNTEDRFLHGASELIQKHVNSATALVWLEKVSSPKHLFELERGQTAALYLQLLREAGRLDEARQLADSFLDDPCNEKVHPALWEETIRSLRGRRQGGATDLSRRVGALAERLPFPQRLRLLSIATTHRVLVASAATTTPIPDPNASSRLALSTNRTQATLYIRQQNYAEAASSLQQAHDLAVQIHGNETFESLELSLQQFEMLLRSNQVQPGDAGWLGSLRSVAAQLGLGSHVEHRLANVWRKAGHQDLALGQYAQVASQYPQDQNGIRSAYQLAVSAEDSGTLNDAQTQYLAIAGNSATTLSVASLCLIGAYRCAVRQNNQDLQSRVIQSLQGLNLSAGSVRQTLLVARQLRDERLGALADAVLNQGLSQYQSLTNSGTLRQRDYLGVTHLVVRRLYEAQRYGDAIGVVNGIDSSYWNNTMIAWGHLAGCLHYACLCSLASYNNDQALAVLGQGSGPLSTRPTQSAHVDLALARVYEQTSGWDAVQAVYNRIIANAPFSSAAMKARLRMARRAWQTGRVDEARQWAASVLFDGKLHTKDPDLAEAYWEAYGIASSKQGAAAAGDTNVYPTLSPHEAIKRERGTRVARIFRLG